MISPFDGFAGLSWAGSSMNSTVIVALGALARTLALVPANAADAAQAVTEISRNWSVWAVPTSLKPAETMTGVQTDCSVGQFRYRADGPLGERAFSTVTGGGAANGLPWSAMAFWSGTAFRGIIVWVWTGRTIDSLGNSVSTLIVDTPAAQFYPTTGDNVYREVYPIIIDATGAVIVDGPSGPCGYQFSSAQAPSANGYANVGWFSADDGVWGIHPGQCVDGDTPGAALGTGGYGFSNYNGSEPIYNYYWGGTAQASSNAVGVVFSA